MSKRYSRLLTGVVAGLTAPQKPWRRANTQLLVANALVQRHQVATRHGPLTFVTTHPEALQFPRNLIGREPETIEWIDGFRTPCRFWDVGANVGTYALVLARHVGAGGKVIAVEPHPVTFARLKFNDGASGYTQTRLVAAAAAPTDGELLIETDGDNLGASRIVTGTATAQTIKVPSLRLQRILDEAGVAKVDALKIDVEGFEDRVLIGFFRQAPPSLWPGAVVIEHLSRAEWQQDCIADMAERGYREVQKTRSNSLLLRG